MSLAASLASQAAVALQNSRLLENIQALFEGFVRASVTAIESRDPTTSGHSFRVADLTVAPGRRRRTAPTRALPRRSASPTEQMREIRYASLLHDFGKVGVREEVLVKAKKLYPAAARPDPPARRADEAWRRAPPDGAQKIDALLREEPRARRSTACPAGTRELAAAPGRARRAPEGRRRRQRAHRDGGGRGLADPAPGPHALPRPPGRAASRDHGRRRRSILSIPRGSLDRRGVQADPVARGAHLPVPRSRSRGRRNCATCRRSPARTTRSSTGRGYPDRISAAEIPVQSRMMTISDIFDALTASDRPYKAAVPLERALDILGFERKAGAVDGDLLDLFIAVKPWEKRASRADARGPRLSRRAARRSRHQLAALATMAASRAQPGFQPAAPQPPHVPRGQRRRRARRARARRGAPRRAAAGGQPEPPPHGDARRVLRCCVPRIV